MEDYKSNNIKLCSDGSYRWVYELSMYRNPSKLISIYKTMGVSLLIVWTFLGLMELSDYGWEGVWEFTKGFFVATLIIVALIFVAYVFLAQLSGGKYWVLFEMDNTCLIHRQLKKHFDKSRSLALLKHLFTASQGDLSTGVSVLQATSEIKTSAFYHVKKVKGNRSQNEIQLQQKVANNSIFVDKEDFDFVYKFIKDHCPSAKD